MAELINVAIVFTDRETGQGFARRLTEWEANLIISQLQALDGGSLKAAPIRAVQLTAVKPRSKH